LFGTVFKLPLPERKSILRVPIYVDMNYKTLGLIAILAIVTFATATVLSDVKTEQIKVEANESCKGHIEEIARNVDGVIHAEWDEETQELNLVFEENDTNLQEIEKNLSEMGFETPDEDTGDKIVLKLSEECIAQQASKNNNRHRSFRRLLKQL
jgi:periplasmic mercuric ion binding protein